VATVHTAFGEEQSGRIRMQELRVIGVPRSGTNLVKYLIENNTDVRCFFNLGWWKHAVIPTFMVQEQIRKTETPTLIMFREPLRQVASFYNFARKGRTAISGAEQFRAFISSPIRMTPDINSIEYHFCTPIEYWTQFYYAATRWTSDNKFFIDLDDLQKDPRILAAVLSEIFSDTQSINPRLPERYLGRNPDRQVSEGWEFEPGTTFDNENREVTLLLTSLSPSEVASILSPHTTALYERLRLDRSP
jgi:hypothetical protein